MKYFYDFEFEESGEYIIPISVGMVSEDGRQLYLINKEYMETWVMEEPYYWKGQYASEPSKWVGQNVIAPLIQERYSTVNWFALDEWPTIIHSYIAQIDKYTNREQIELWGYYGAYDHVCLAQLWGPMINLPEPIPMFTHEIMQLKHGQSLPPRDLTKLPEHNALSDALYQKQLYESWS